MKRCGFSQSALSTREEMPGSVSIPLLDRIDTVICPKPRRLAVLHPGAVNDHPFPAPVRPLRLHLSHQMDLCDSKAGNDLLDMILTKGGCGVEQPSIQVASSPPPFFCGSPPSRVANPLIHDARFGDEKLSPFSPVTLVQPPTTTNLSSSSSSSPTRKGGYIRSNLGNKPAVRVEGFDCLDRDSRNCSIPTLA
ncbi:hypothetical protein K2173_017144 [Erythroxylum novogranatense]|uniref:Uncharacterized protein n=1 Tax=Erythroxylum novogranatense TaxID=1862640 RepID=A0AAV8U8P2_9ROSI|nr:hypothetical protein K2173_017144 [Erythroxylum novogranatense]